MPGDLLPQTYLALNNFRAVCLSCQGNRLLASKPSGTWGGNVPLELETLNR